ncbi:branched-chain amino acid ABC transporter substrate-binding protein [Salinicoccus sp. ID82-1]|uniref:branched-chain amino acid ABC transporter substrate-binding protein n=1 Tax=Salinicoccus sp. ID82-1 TaxID=2820269 RepID=UPI001F37B265|nr:branched-chain amino acid ABC transporter substrate-binding protein [Salinicoccus sp. ID82-1]MCG1008935.1 branched-chain amino acid ABC transporter substrate-binding protein [Salinicoccus sp. ID82-1]
MKKIKDERLILSSLKNIRIAFIVQTLSIMAILLYTGFTEGASQVVQNPLWFVFIITMTLLAFLNINISVDTGDAPNKSHSFFKTFILIFAGSVIVGIINFILTDELLISLSVATVLLVCFTLSFAYMFYLRAKRSRDLDS